MSDRPRAARPRGLSLSARIALVTVAAVVVAVLVAVAIAFPLTRQAAQEESADNLERIAAATAATIEQGGDRDVAIRGRLAATLRSEDITAYYLPPGARLPGLLDPGEEHDLDEGESISTQRSFQGQDVLVSAHALRGGGAVVLVQPVNAVGGLATSTLARLSLALVIGVAIAIIFGLLLARRLTRSLRDAAHAAQRLGAGDRNVELAVTGPPEIAELSEAMNDLQHALSVSEGRQREFLLSISHELRTPLTAIRGYSEAIADDVVPPERIPATAATMQAEADRLDLLVSDLLDLARLDAVDFRISAVPVDITELAKVAATVWSDQCDMAGVDFRFETANRKLEVMTDPTRVRQIIDNLCANALRVTPMEGIVVLAVSPGAVPGHVQIQVRDSGPGLTEDDMTVAFVPGELYQRYRGVRRVGTGVGLALVGRLSQRLGGSAVAGRGPEGGASFTIVLPVSGPGRP